MKINRIFLSAFLVGIYHFSMSQMDYNARNFSISVTNPMNPFSLENSNSDLLNPPGIDNGLINRLNHSYSPSGSSSNKTPSSDINLPGKSIYFNVHLGSSYLYNKDVFNSYWEIKKNIGFQFEIGYIKRMNDLLSYGFGIGASSYPSEIHANSRLDTVYGRDFDNVTPQDDLEKRVEYLSMSEKTNLIYIDVPLFLELGNANNSQVGYFIRLGIKASFPLMNKFDGMGNYSIKGYYPEYDVEIAQEIPQLGFYHDEQLYSGQNKYEINSFNISGLISAGVSLPLDKKWILRLGANYTHGFLDISKEVSSANNEIETDVNHILENSQSPTLTRSLGVEFGIQHRLKYY